MTYLTYVWVEEMLSKESIITKKPAGLLFVSKNDESLKMLHIERTFGDRPGIREKYTFGVF